jgi:hypothetical protein
LNYYSLAKKNLNVFSKYVENIAKKTPKSSLGVIFFSKQFGLNAKFCTRKKTSYIHWGKKFGQGFSQASYQSSITFFIFLFNFYFKK